MNGWLTYVVQSMKVAPLARFESQIDHLEMHRLRNLLEIRIAPVPALQHVVVQHQLLVKELLHLAWPGTAVESESVHAIFEGLSLVVVLVRRDALPDIDGLVPGDRLDRTGGPEGAGDMVERIRFESGVRLHEEVDHVVPELLDALDGGDAEVRASHQMAHRVARLSIQQRARAVELPRRQHSAIATGPRPALEVRLPHAVDLCEIAHIGRRRPEQQQSSHRALVLPAE